MSDWEVGEPKVSLNLLHSRNHSKTNTYKAKSKTLWHQAGPHCRARISRKNFRNGKCVERWQRVPGWSTMKNENSLTQGQPWKIGVSSFFMQAYSVLRPWVSKRSVSVCCMQNWAYITEGFLSTLEVLWFLIGELFSWHPREEFVHLPYQRKGKSFVGIFPSFGFVKKTVILNDVYFLFICIMPFVFIIFLKHSQFCK